MNLYRVHITELETDQILVPNTNGFISNLSGTRKVVEGFIESEIPEEVSLTSRKECVFLFCELKNALEYCLNFKRDQHVYIYTASVDSTDILRKCDMGLIDIANKLVEFGACEDIIKKICQLYWNNGHTAGSCYEYLVKKATIKSCLWDGRVSEIEEQYLNLSSMERVPLYLGLLSSSKKDCPKLSYKEL